MTSIKTPNGTEAKTVPAAETVDPLDALSTPEEMDEPRRQIDDRIKRFVEEGLKRTEAAPRKWSWVKLPESEIKRVVREAKRYARETGRTFRVKNTGDATRLVYRVVAKVKKEAE